jgi:hypothetical protein
MNEKHLDEIFMERMERQFQNYKETGTNEVTDKSFSKIEPQETAEERMQRLLTIPGMSKEEVNEVNELIRRLGEGCRKSA